MIEGFDVKDVALGTGDSSVYTFDFKIYKLTDLLIWIQDASGAIVSEVRGDDTTILSSVVFDSDEGGGTITLVSDLTQDYVMTMLLAIDDPDQPFPFGDKGAFDLNVIEGALDYFASSIQSVMRRALRAVVVHDLDDLDLFNPTLPLGIGANPGGVVSVKSDGSGFEIVITTGSIAAAQGYAANALASQNAAATSAAASATSAAQAAASAAAAQSGIFPYGTAAAPLTKDGSVAVPFNDPTHQEEMTFLQGSGAGTTVMAVNPQIANGTAIGQRVYLVGCNDAQVLKFVNGNGLLLNGDCPLAQDDVLGLFWNGTKWCEMFRRSAT